MIDVVDEDDKRLGSTYFKPALVKGVGIGLKVVSTYRDNGVLGLPTVPGTIFLTHPENGLPMALMGATFLSGFRTAAGSAVATKYMSREDSRVLAVYGAGLQARCHIEAILVVRPSLTRVCIWNRTEATARKLCIEMQAKYPSIDFSVNGDADALASEADIIVTATASTVPLFDGSYVKQGAHINAVGTSRPDARELGTATVARSRLVVDDINSCIVAGDIAIPMAEGDIGRSHIICELGDVVTGKKIIRTNQDTITLFKSSGTAIQDITTAVMFYNKAIKENRGLQVDM
eukprot:gene14812-17511_t